MFFCLAVLLLSLGAWSLTFKQTEGKLLSYKELMVGTGGGFPGINYSDALPSLAPIHHVEYYYSVDNVGYVSKLIGMGARSWSLSPFGKMRWEHNTTIGRSIPVYHSRLLPRLAVLHRGIDPLMIFMFSLAGYGCIRLSLWIDSHAADA